MFIVMKTFIISQFFIYRLVPIRATHVAVYFSLRLRLDLDFY